MKKLKKTLAAILSVGMLAGPTLGEIPVHAAGKEINIDFSKTDGEMIPKTGWLLMPNENIPDGRIIPLNTKDVRDDIDTQNLLGNNGNGNSEGQLQDVLPNEGNRLARIKHGFERMKELGIDNYYPIMGYMPSWVSSNGKPQGTPKDYGLWKQWVKDIVQYMKDNDLDITEYNVWNENWAISVDNFNKMYEQAWHAGREVMPESKMIGPSPWTDDAGTIKSLADYCESVGITLDIASWHFGNHNNLPNFQQGLEDYISQKPSIGEPKYYYEEYTTSGDVANLTKEFAIYANFDRADVDAAIRGIWTYVNGLSDQLVTKQGEENPYARRDIWWLMTTYGAMSGTRVKQSGDDLYIASYDEEKGEAKVLIGNQDGNVKINMNNFPFAGEKVHVDKYRITQTENDGLQYQESDESVTAGETVSTNVNFDGTGDIWMLVVKKDKSAPSDFALMGPDDGFATTLAPEFSWQKSQGADSYDFTISKNKDLSDPVFSKKDIKETTYQLEKSLDAGETYYWSVVAKNAYGTKQPYNGMYYTLLASEDVEIPGSFTMLQVIDEDFGTSLTPKVSWTIARDADKYVIHIAEDKNFADEITIEVTDPGYYSAGQNNDYYYYNLAGDQALKPETHYYAKVEAVNEHGSRMMNGTAHEFTTTTADGKPAEFKVTAPKDGQTTEQRSTLRWEPSIGSFFYRLEIASDENFENIVLQRDTITVPAYTLEENVLLPGQDYYWRVTARTKDGQQETPCTNGTQKFTMSATPTAPVVKTAIPASGGAVVLFNKVQEADSYLVKYGAESGKYTESLETKDNMVYIPLESDDQTYYCTVVAVTNGVESASYNEVKAHRKAKSETGIEVDKRIEIEDATELSGASIVAGKGYSSNLAIDFDKPNEEATFKNMPACDKIQLSYMSEKDTTLGIYLNEEKVQEIELYETGGDVEGTVEITVDCKGGDSLSFKKETKEKEFILDYMILSKGEKLENLALNKPVEADSAHSKYPKEYAVDGEIAGGMDFWIGGKVPTEDKPNWLDVNLENKAEIHSIEIALPNIDTWGPRTQEFRILTSVDGQEYTEQVAKTAYEFKYGNEGNNNKYTVVFETPLEATNVKVEIYSNSDTGKVGQIGELYVMGKYVTDDGNNGDITGKNLAFEKKVNANGIGYGNPSAIVDGDKSTFADFGSENFPNEVIVDLEKIYVLERFEMYLPTGWGTRNQEIEFLTSLDGKIYNPLVEKASYKFEQGTNHATLQLPENSAGRYIKIIGTANDEADKPGMQFGEFEVYGSYGQRVEGIALNKNATEMKTLATEQLTVTFTPENVTNNLVSWSSSNFDVARVDTNGIVTAIAPGEAEIRARSIDGNFKAVCTVTVKKNNVVSVMNPEAMEVPLGTELKVEELPNTLKVKLEQNVEEELEVTWDTSSYKANEPGTYEIVGTLTETENIENVNNIQAKLSVTVLPSDTAAGWIETENGWEYYENGQKAVGWKDISGTWYYFDENGIMEIGWLSLGNTWYYLNESGAMETGWVSVGGTWYYMNASGAMETGWASIGETWYYLNTDGSMATGWVSVNGNWYYLNTDGSMVTGWVSVNGNWYYLNTDGSMATGWVFVNGNWYYLNTDGSMVTNQWIGGYYLDASGKML